jgi:hypothetical protein
MSRWGSVVSMQSCLANIETRTVVTTVRGDWLDT